MALRSFGAESTGRNFVRLAELIVESKQLGRYYDHEGVSRSGMVVDLENQVQNWTNRRYAVAQASGTQSLVTALNALGTAGREVVVPAYSFAACPIAIQVAGATPVLVGCRPDLSMDPEAVERAITSRTAAVMIVHMRGRPSDAAVLTNVARSRGLPVIEDLSQFDGMGDERGNPDVGHSDIIVFSFQSRKMLSAGEGGMIATNDEQLFRAVTQMTDTAWFMREPHKNWPEPKSLPGVGSRMNEATAALVLSQWAEVMELAHRGREICAELTDALAGFLCQGATDEILGVGAGLTLGLRVRTASQAQVLVATLRAMGYGVYPESAGGVEAHTYRGWPEFVRFKSRIDVATLASLEHLDTAVLLQVQPDWDDDSRDALIRLVRSFA